MIEIIVLLLIGGLYNRARGITCTVRVSLYANPTHTSDQGNVSNIIPAHPTIASGCTSHTAARAKLYVI